MTFSNVFEICNQYHCILPSHFQILRWNRETVQKGHWWVCCFMRIYNNLKKHTAVFCLRGINSYLFLMFLSLETNIVAYYLLVSIFYDEIMKTVPIGHWWICCFMRMYNNLVPKIQRSLLSRGIYSYIFLMSLSFENNIISYYLLKHQILRCNDENSHHRTLMSLLLHEDVL